MAKAVKKAKKKVAKKAMPKKVKCAGKTKDGKTCKRMVAGPGKYCYLHKNKKK